MNIEFFPIKTKLDIYMEEYYAFVDKIDELENNRFIIHFDAVEVSDVDQLSQDTIMTFEQYEKMKCSVIIGDYSKRIFDDLKAQFEIKEELEGSWLTLKLSEQPTQFQVERFQENYESEPESQINYIHPGTTRVQVNTEKKLKKLFSIPTSAKINFNRYIRKKKAENIWIDNQEQKRQVFDVAVYDVGQGNFNALIDENGIPIAYYDIGGGAYFNARTYPPNKLKKICLTHDPLIILSHWDFDHWWTFNKLMRNGSIPNGLKTNWIVPEQDLGPVQTKFFKLLINNGHDIKCWPNNSRTHQFDEPFGKLIKCKGKKKDKNNSGIALIAIGPFCKILLPGDASYSSIPNLKKYKFSGLVATHHGGKSKDNKDQCPIPSTKCGKIVYSYGEDNIYHHPSGKTVIKYIRAGWTDIKETKDGSAAFLANEPFNAPCGGRCDLNIDQVF